MYELSISRGLFDLQLLMPSLKPAQWKDLRLEEYTLNRRTLAIKLMHIWHELPNELFNLELLYAVVLYGAIERDAHLSCLIGIPEGEHQK